jgi:hypothetical protein
MSYMVLEKYVVAVKDTTIQEISDEVVHEVVLEVVREVEADPEVQGRPPNPLAILNFD